MMPFKDARLSVVTPVYRNETTLRELSRRTLDAARDRFASVEHVFVNDGSPDGSRQVLCELAKQRPEVKVVNLARNFGQHVALIVGLEYASGDYVMFIDADLEESPEDLPVLMAKMTEGFEIVIGRRTGSKRSLFGRFAARAYARAFNFLSDLNVEHELSTMRLMTRRYSEYLRQLPERPFIGGFTAWIGIPPGLVPLKALPRGGSSYTLRKLLSHARVGLVGFSNKPIQFAFYGGMVVSGASILWGTAMIVVQLVWGGVAVGYTSLVAIITFLMGAQFMFTGLLGEYVGEIFLIVKRRPAYLVYDKFNL